MAKAIHRAFRRLSFLPGPAQVTSRRQSGPRPATCSCTTIPRDVNHREISGPQHSVHRIGHEKRHDIGAGRFRFPKNALMGIIALPPPFPDGIQKRRYCVRWPSLNNRSAPLSGQARGTVWALVGLNAQAPNSPKIKSRPHDENRIVRRLHTYVHGTDI